MVTRSEKSQKEYEQMVQRLSPEQLNTAIRDQDHLKRWIQETRPWIVFRGEHLVDALPFPHGHEALQQIIMCYRDHRRTIPSGETEKKREPLTGALVDVPKFLEETLSRDEMDACVRYLINQLRAADPNWVL